VFVVTQPTRLLRNRRHPPLLGHWGRGIRKSNPAPKGPIKHAVCQGESFGGSPGCSAQDHLRHSRRLAFAASLRRGLHARHSHGRAHKNASKLSGQRNEDSVGRFVNANKTVVHALARLVLSAHAVFPVELCASCGQDVCCALLVLPPSSCPGN